MQCLARFTCWVDEGLLMKTSGATIGYMDPRYPHLKGKHPAIRRCADQTTLEVHLEGGIVATWQTMHSEIHLEVK